MSFTLVHPITPSAAHRWTALLATATVGAATVLSGCGGSDSGLGRVDRPRSLPRKASAWPSLAAPSKARQ
jgi:hypothetical protein